MNATSDYHLLQRIPMANTLAPLLESLLRLIDGSDSGVYVEALDRKRRISECFEVLMNHLRKMMLGYETDEVHRLFKEMELEVDLIDAQHFSRLSSDVILETCEKLCNIRYGSYIDGEETVVGVDEEVETLLDQLTATSTKQLQIISITGMAGLGKTTLARKLYSHPLIEYMFTIRAWTCVSQVYVKRRLLLGILSTLDNDATEENYNMTDEHLGEKLYRLLKGRKYLVVLDDIWDCIAWNELSIYFPDDKTESRIVFTSRDIDVSLHVGAARPPHVLRLRTEDESWAIFQMKVFRTGICPYRLQEFGRLITRNCKGLPLAIVISAGPLNNQSPATWWKQIAESPHSFLVHDPTQYMDSLSLSYNHLPRELQRCFLFVGVFPEDYDIPVRKLMWLWVAHGFIPETENRTLEDVAKDFLMDLIKRNLLMTSKRRADGQIKACRIHDLLRDLCLKKGKEEIDDPIINCFAPDAGSSDIVLNFFLKVFPEWRVISDRVLPRWEANKAASLPSPHYGLYSYAPAPKSSSSVTDMVHGMCYPYECGTELLSDGFIPLERYYFLRILDVESVQVSVFPYVYNLVNLRYLAIQARVGSPQAYISSLANLEMLIILSEKNIVLPTTIWNMVNLRHLYLKSKTGENVIQAEMDGIPSVLASLQSLSQVCPQSYSFRNISSRTPNLRKLGFCGPLVSIKGNIEFPNIRSLEHLRKLKLFNSVYCSKLTRLLNATMFPEKLKKLTLANTGMDWEDTRVLTLLLNLEVLNLKFHACIGRKWETGDAKFQRLKVLKLHNLDLSRWVCSRDNFPCLQRLVIRHCLNLNSIPSDIGRIWTLEEIEVQGCKKSVQVSALKIQKEQESDGNCFLKVHANNNYS